MKILHVITTINRGGAENHLADLVGMQILEGHAICVAYLKEDPYWKARMESAGARVVDLGMRRYGDPRPLFRLRNLIGELVPDVLHAHMPPAETYARLSLIGATGTKTVLIVSKHNDEPFFRGPFEIAMSRWVGRGASGFIAISDAVRNYVLRRRIFSDTGNIESIPYGIDPEPFEKAAESSARELRKLWAIPENAYVIGAVARLVPQKALHVLLDAFSIYSKQTGKTVRLVIVGRGPLEQTLKAKAEELGISELVVWAGFREDIPIVMRAFDAFALTSEYEGLGLVLLEAMAAAKPIIATRVSAIPEVVVDKATGILVDSGDSDELARGMRFFEQEEARILFGSAGHERVRTRFTLTGMSERTTSLYRRFVSQGSGSPENALNR